MMQLQKVLLSIGLLFGCLLASGQKAEIRLHDNRSREAVAFAHVVLTDFEGKSSITLVSDMEGKVSVALEEAQLISISALGYHLLFDTIRPGEKKKLLLQATTYNMDEVVVTGQYTPQAVDKSIFRVKVIGAKTIGQKASNNLGELMAGELNIRTSFDGALGSRITLQGLGGEHIKFLVDGVPLIGRMNGNIDLGQLNLYNVKQIEVIEGPMSVIYGSNALAGVINIITKESDQMRYTANAASYLESVGVYNFNADISASRNKWSGSVAAARNFFDGYNPDADSRSKRWKPKRQYNADANISYRSKDLQLRMNLSYFNEKF